METVVKIIWDKPKEQQWLCAENIKIALSQYCKNTEFKVIEIKPPKNAQSGQSNGSLSFGISNITKIGLGFMDRIRVLFGKEIRVNIDFEVNKEVDILKTEAKTTVAPFFKPKPSKNDCMQTAISTS